MNFVKEFKEFVSRGNVIDLAVGVIIGAAFGKIVTSLVDDVIMPPIGYILGGIDFSDKKLVLIHANLVDKVSEVAIRYGNFINSLIQFLIVALCIFAILKAINSIKRKEVPKPKKDSELTKEEILLTEIRDLLRNQQR